MKGCAERCAAMRADVGPRALRLFSTSMWDWFRSRSIFVGLSKLADRGARSQEPLMSPFACAIHRVVALVDRTFLPDTGGSPRKFAQIAHLLRWRSICSASRKPVIVAAHSVHVNQKGLEMKRRANLLRISVLTALLALAIGSFVVPDTVHAQGAIGQPKGDQIGRAVQ